jgi:hypothetical protein
MASKNNFHIWRRWTGIEPARRGSLVSTALKAAEPTRRTDTSIRKEYRVLALNETF